MLFAGRELEPGIAAASVDRSVTRDPGPFKPLGGRGLHPWPVGAMESSRVSRAFSWPTDRLPGVGLVPSPLPTPADAMDAVAHFANLGGLETYGRRERSCRRSPVRETQGLAVCNCRPQKKSRTQIFSFSVFLAGVSAPDQALPSIRWAV